VPGDFWRISIRSEDLKEATLLGFGRAYRFSKTKDLRKAVTGLPEGIAACSPSLIAGKRHLESVLIQSAEYWSRGIFLARNKSIDLLMRLTCQDQISRALQASAIDNCREVALIGLAKDDSDIAISERLMSKLGGIRDDSLMDLDSNKMKFLLRFHSLPSWIEQDKIPQLLQEKSAILVFQR
jgi:tRNA threonylcarbamoyladenosine modification (KEOPS) complex Cgi121 subunit